MITIEEEIWDYIDGSGTAGQLSVTEHKIATDPVYTALYEEFLAIHEQMDAMELEEPSMSFNRNVMDRVELEIAPVALKTKVNKRIIYSIAAFFILFITGVFGYAIATIDMSASILNFDLNLQMENVEFGKLINPTFIKIFLFVDVLLGLAYLDTYLRRKRA